MDWETSFATYTNPFPLCGCECCLVAALAYSFSKSTRVSLTCKRYGSLLTRVNHLSSPSDRLSSFPQEHTRRWCQGRAENWVPEISILNGNLTRNLLEWHRQKVWVADRPLADMLVLFWVGVITWTLYFQGLANVWG